MIGLGEPENLFYILIFFGQKVNCIIYYTYIGLYTYKKIRKLFREMWMLSPIILVRRVYIR
jgi:hypothetical protein